MKGFLPPLIFLLCLIGIQAHAQTKVYATNLVSSSHTTNVGNSVDGNEGTRSIIESHAGYLLGIGSYDGHIELAFPTMVPANQTFYLRINTEDNILDALLGGTLGDILSGVVGGLAGGSQNFTIQVNNNNTEVMSLYSGFAANFSGDQGKIVSDIDGNFYLAITPPQAYNRVRITNNLNSLLGLGNVKTMEVWDAYYVSAPDMCNEPKFTSYDVTGLNLDLLQLSNVSANNERAIDGDMNTKSTLSFGVLAIGATVIQRAHFESPSIVGEEFGIRFGSSTNFLSLNLFTNLRVKAMKGTQVVYNEVLNNVIPQNVRDSLANNGVTTFYFTPNASVDKITFEYSAVLGLNVAQSVDIYEFIKRPASPILDVNASNLTICQGTAATVQATTSIPNATIYYYESATSTTPLASAPSGQSATFGAFFNTTLIYAASGFPGCSYQSRRLPIEVTVIEGPSNTELSVPNLLPIYCASEEIILQAQSASGNITRWHLTNTFNNIIYTDTTVNGITYTVNPANQELIITGAQMSSNPIQVYLSTFNISTGCWSAPGGLLPVEINLQDENAPTLASTFPSTCLIEASTLGDLNVVSSNPNANIIWYSTATATTTIPSTTVMQPGTTYYAAAQGQTCISATRLPITPAIIDEPAPTTLATSQFFCTADMATLDNLLVSGTNIQWYDANDNLLPNSTLVIDGITYYATSTGAECESAEKLGITTVISDLPTPTTDETTQYFCPQNNPTINDISVTSANVAWFTTPTGGTALPSGTHLNNNTVYYGAITSANCSSSIRLAVLVMIETVNAPTTQNVVQNFCAPLLGEPALTLADLTVQPTEIAWYSTANGTTPLAANTPLVSNTTYYAAAVGDHCESANRIFVYATINTPATPTTLNTEQTFCASTVPTIASIQVGQGQVIWYDVIGGTPLVSTTPLVNNTTYYGYLEDQGCLSPTPLEVIVDYEIVSAPNFTSGTQFFCPQPSYLGAITVAQLNTNGQQIQWFESATSTTPLASTTALVNNATYYAATVGSNCISTLRTPVYVVLESINVPTTNDTTQLFCRSTIPTVADIQISPSSVVWYDAEFGGSVVSLTDELINNAYYYAAGSNGTCESGNRRSVLVNFEVVTPITTNESIQFFCPPAANEVQLTIADLTIDTLGFGVNGIGVIWYDAPNGGNTLTSTTPLVNNTTYYVGKEQGLCLSDNRTSIYVVIDGITTPGSINVPQNFCGLEAPTVANLQALNPSINWYDAPTGGVNLPSTTTLVDGTTYYAELFNANCSSPSRLPTTVNVEIIAPTNVSTPLQVFCAPLPGEPVLTLSDLDIDNQSIVWYTSAMGGSILPNNTPLTNNGVYYASLEGTTCNSPTRAIVMSIISAPAAPTTSLTEQHFCASNTPTIDDLSVNENNVVWYSDITLTSIIQPGTALNNGQTYYGTLSNMHGCISTNALQVTASFDILPGLTNVENFQVFCNSDNNTLADLDVANVNVVWYDAPTNGNVLPTSTLLQSGETYYAFATNGTCESSDHAEINVVFESVPSPTAQPSQIFCNNTVATVADLLTNESGAIWYDSPTSLIPLNPNTPLQSGMIYYAALEGQNCESTSRIEVFVNIESVGSPTTTENTQILCGGDSYTLDSLQVDGTGIIWYDSPTSTSVLPNTTVLVSNTVYYAANLGDECESLARLPIYVIVETLGAPTTTNASQTFCSEGTPTIAEIQISPSNVQWFDADQNMVYGSTPLVDGATYYAYTQGVSCLSNENVAVTVSVNNPTNGQLSYNNADPCMGDTVVYTAPTHPTNFVWTITGGNIIAGGTSTSNTATVVWTGPSSSLNLTYTVAGNCVTTLPNALNFTFSNCSDLQILKTASTNIAFIGDNIEFVVTVTNDGQNSNDNIEVSEVIRSGFEYVSHTVTHGSYSPVSGIWTIPTLEGSGVATLVLTTKVLDGGDHTNLAYVMSANLPDSKPGNDSSLVVIDVECLTIYNEISPNGDGKNDVFYIDCLDQYDGTAVTIFNRHGNLVYQVDDYKNDWNGSTNVGGVLGANEALPAGTYFYVLNIKGQDKEGKDIKEKSGWIYIIR